MTMFRFGCNHVTRDPEIHEATWGARLIYAEVTAGGSGVVYNRQTPEGEPESVGLLFPVIDRAMQEFREHQYELPGDSRGHLCWRDGRALVVMSPQQSYGYLYVTAVLEKEDHVGESKVWDMSDQMDSPYRKCPQLGNWPPEIYEARLAKERELERRAILSRVANAAQDSRWQLRKVWAAKTERSKTMAQNKLTKMDDEVAAARQAAFAAGFTEAEVDKAMTGYGY